MNVYKRYFEENLGRELPIYGYSPPPNGQWQIDDTIFETEDFRTVEKYREYKECGFNVLFLQHSAKYDGDGWENSETKLAMERAVEAGLDKIILVDMRIFELSLIEEGLIGEGKRFASEAELDDFIRNCIKDYRHQKGFYGVQLRDEPFWPYLKTVGQIFRSIARVDSSIFVHCNLNPMHGASLTYRICPPGQDMIAAYENYLSMFLEETGTNHLMMDIYPFHRAPDKSPMSKFYFAGLECVARVCKKYGAEMHIVMQSFGMDIRGKHYHYFPTEKQMQYQKNVLMAFGVKQYSYFTYWTKQMNRTDGEMFPDGKAMMNRRGEKTKMYYFVQKINNEIKAMSPLLSCFDYRANAYYFHTPFRANPTFLEMTRGSELSQITGVETDKETVMVTELFDKTKGQYMHSVVNVVEPKIYVKRYGKEKQRTEITFDGKYNVADVYYKKKWTTVALPDGKFTVELAPGEGVLILPYNTI